MGEVNALDAFLRDGEIRDRDIDVSVGGRLNKLPHRRNLFIFELKLEFGCERFPEFDSHAREPAVFFHHEGRTNVKPDFDRLPIRLRALLSAHARNCKRADDEGRKEAKTEETY